MLNYILEPKWRCSISHQMIGITAKISPVISIDETCRGNPCPRGHCAKLSHGLLVKRLIDCLKFVVLILAHAPILFLKIGMSNPNFHKAAAPGTP